MGGRAPRARRKPRRRRRSRAASLNLRGFRKFVIISSSRAERAREWRTVSLLYKEPSLSLTTQMQDASKTVVHFASKKSENQTNYVLKIISLYKTSIKYKFTEPSKFITNRLVNNSKILMNLHLGNSKRKKNAAFCVIMWTQRRFTCEKRIKTTCEVIHLVPCSCRDALCRCASQDCKRRACSPMYSTRSARAH